MSKLVHDQKWQVFRSAIDKASCKVPNPLQEVKGPTNGAIYYKSECKQTTLGLWVWNYTGYETILENFRSAMNKADCLRFFYSYLEGPANGVIYFHSEVQNNKSGLVGMKIYWVWKYTKEFWVCHK